MSASLGVLGLMERAQITVERAEAEPIIFTMQIKSGRTIYTVVLEEDEAERLADTLRDSLEAARQQVD